MLVFRLAWCRASRLSAGIRECSLSAKLLLCQRLTSKMPWICLGQYESRGVSLGLGTKTIAVSGACSPDGKVTRINYFIAARAFAPRNPPTGNHQPALPTPSAHCLIFFFFITPLFRFLVSSFSNVRSHCVFQSLDSVRQTRTWDHHLWLLSDVLENNKKEYWYLRTLQLQPSWQHYLTHSAAQP